MNQINESSDENVIWQKNQNRTGKLGYFYSNLINYDNST